MERVGEILGKMSGSQQPTRNGGPASDTSHPTCRKCLDFGQVHPVVDGQVDYSQVETCICQRERVERERNERLVKHCHLPSETESKTFDNYKARNKTFAEAKEYAMRMATGDDSTKWLTIISETGCGKTHLCVAICREWIARGIPAKYTFVPELLDDIRDSFRKDEASGQGYSATMEMVKTVPLLVLDDMGVERRSDWASEVLPTIIDYRSRYALPLVVTTNLALDNLPNDPEGRIRSRLQRETWCHVVMIDVEGL